MPVVGELVEAQVGHYDDGIADLVLDLGDADVEDPVGGGGTATGGIAGRGHAEQHDAAEAEVDRLTRGLAKRGTRVLHDARKRRDRHRSVDPLTHEQREYETGRMQARLGDESTHRGGTAQSTRALLREGHVRSPCVELRPDACSAARPTRPPPRR